MAISLVGVAEGFTNSGGGSDVTITLPAGLAQNDLVCVFGGHNQTGTNAGVSTSGYTEALDTTTTGLRASFSWKRMGVSPDSSVICVGGASGLSTAYVVMAFRGVDTTTAIDATTTSASGTSTNPNSPSITTVTDGAAVISFAISSNADTTVTAPSGYGDQVDVAAVANAAAGGAWKAVSAAGAENPASWTNWAVGTWLAFSAALRPAAAGVNSDADFSATGTCTALFVGEAPTEGILAVTATAETNLVGAPFVNSPLSATGTAVVAWGGNSLSTGPVAFSMTGTGTAAFVGALAGGGSLSVSGTVAPAFSGASVASVRAILTGLGQVQWVGATSKMESVREDIRSRGAASVNM